VLQRRDSLRHKNELLTTFRTINNWRRKLGLRADIVNNASNGLSATIAYKFYLRSDFKFTELRFGYKEAYIFMAEAIPALQQAGRMKIGQPFDVEIIGDE
jgi:hypothetical protein